MSQYEDYFFSEEQRENQISMLHSPCYNEARYDNIHYFMDEDFSKQAAPTEEIYENTEKQSDPVKYNKIQLINNASTKERKKRVIQIDQHIILKRKEIYKGLKDDTTELTTNLKTILVKKFRELISSKQMGSEQKRIIEQFSKSSASFVAIKRLLNSERIRQKGLKYIKSQRIVSQILRSQSQMENKLTLIKYLKCVQMNFEDLKIIKWKQIQAI